MTRYACTQPGCPRRPAVTADAAPTCYTCGGTMAEVARPVFILEPYIYEDDFFDCKKYDPSRATDEDLQRLVELTGTHRVHIPEQPPENHATRTLSGVTIEVTPPRIDDLEAFGRQLLAEILRALSEPDPCPYVGTGKQALVRAIEQEGGALIDPEAP